ncbi:MULTISPECIES: flagellar protein FlhE [unclassified Herbaspirillum]|uniref:flagellar protein FlhE n=1 Tax=unclassified Herbaspirillum TaxID=2624150 RepID=UPI001150978B|nr:MULTISPECIES: flagellar protein FlhE [unclassified Herbaspirillum]MBB5393065.1 flagellar protein FlhE [Herbaspirillum sp. SJZ102]TQK04292.1 flagellar protein FlhE [Herbaspirillum sp. SJZ130]TQK09923.1 flagellar protein FlhE [Herbaspirillum sp. SJZ106]
MADCRRFARHIAPPLLFAGLLGIACGANAQSYADRNFSVSPAAREGARPIIIVSPVQPGPPPSPAPAAPKSGPIGSYASDAAGPDIRAKNADYATRFQVVGHIPAGSTINKVAWRYGVARKPPGFEAVLCWQDAATCWTVTDANTGDTDFFNGKDAARPFMLFYRVKGNGYMKEGPVKGDMNQIIVTYDVPG